MAQGGIIAFKAIHVTNAFRNRERLRQWLHAVAADQGRHIGELTYVLLSDKGLLPYNRQYLGHNEYTDVITFGQDDRPGVSGDILISYDRVRDNARTFGATAQEELHRVMVHGLLHLLGHGDKGPAKQKAMRAAEDKYLALLKQ